MDVAASRAPASERSAAAAPQPVLVVLLVTSALCSLALLLARAFTWPAQGRPRAFEYLFLRNEPTAAWLSCAIILGAALAATGVRSLPAVAGARPLPIDRQDRPGGWSGSACGASRTTGPVRRRPGPGARKAEPRAIAARRFAFSPDLRRSQAADGADQLGQGASLPSASPLPPSNGHTGA